MDLRAVRPVLLGLWLPLVTACGSAKSADQPAAGASAGTAAPPAIRYQGHIAAGGIAPPSGELVNPFAGDAKSAVEGGKLFTSMNCDGCHGGGAIGFIAPSLSDGRYRYGSTDAELYQTIFYGRPDGMPAFGGVLAAPIVWKLVTYLKSLPVPASVPTQAW
jgi:cytochrome c oxidase cbb3-type subunit 3